jgi:hypothetical protein
VGLIDFPNPVQWHESAVNAGMERESASAVLSAVYSFWITAMWSLGQKKYFSFLADAATSMYLSLATPEKKELLALSIPTAMLEAKNLSRFTTVQKGGSR